ncbi:[protein-PII] uridylyltransferase [Paroceanicella profunda]
MRMDSALSTRRRAASVPSEADHAADGLPLILPAGEIIDMPALARAIEAAAGTPGAAEARSACVALLRAAKEEAHAAIAAALEARPFAGPEAASSYAWVADRIVSLTISTVQERLHPLPNPTACERMAVLAVGGYGRAEMAPFSDVDLLFLTPYKQTPWGESVIESVLYILWDLKLKIGHSVRTVDDCLRLGREDITIRTALLEQRFLMGDRTLADTLDDRLWKELFSRTGPDFVEAKLGERGERHRRQGGSRYLVEPNVKEGKGGLRDLQTLYWIAKYLYHADTPEELVEKGVFAEDEVATFNEAEGFLWTVRCHLHLISGRAVEQLTFDMQVEIAERLGFTDTLGRRAVENFMQVYFTHALQVGELTRIFCAMLEAQHVKSRPPLGPRLRRAFGFGRNVLPEEFRERDGRVDFAEGIDIAAEPILMLRIFQVSLNVGMLIHPAAFRALANNLDGIETLRETPEANEIFLDLLLNTNNPERALRRLNETGALGAFMPEFGHIVALMQFNMYHHYTVDEHTIQAVSFLSRIERGEMKVEVPLASDIMRQGLEREVIYLALLLHDIGKGRPGDHSEVGAAIARVVCPRLGCDAVTTESVEWLVRHHLLMSDVAQRRDISDPRTVQDFARIVQTPERLRKLYVLTVCDIMAVGPGTWNNWKGQLLRQLYDATRAYITGDADPLSRRDRVAEAKAALVAEYSKHTGPEAVEEELERHYPSYWLGFDTETQLLFALMDEDILPDEIYSQVIPDPERDATKVAFYMEDHPGIFSRIAGALALAGANVVDARCFTTTDGYVTSAFWVQDNQGKPYEKSRLDRLRRSVERTLKGEVIAGEEFKVKDKVKRRVKDFTVPTQVIFDNDGSEIYTIIEVSARDRPGLLYDLTRILSGLGISIASAVVATYGEQAVDVFYVKDLFGLKLHSEPKRRSIEARLRAAIEGNGSSA